MYLLSLGNAAQINPNSYLIDGNEMEFVPMILPARGTNPFDSFVAADVSIDISQQ